MTVSIIIAVKTWQENLARCVRECQKLEASDFEIIILPDVPFPQGGFPAVAAPVIVIPTAAVSPGIKRDRALERARGEILAFIDDDAYPRRDWLTNALVHFRDPEVAAVGGPAVTPDEDSLEQKASGAIYSSFLVSGGFAYRYLPKETREVDDYPSCNFLVRKSVMQSLGGFKTNFWPGEDTKLCLDITRVLKKKIIYDPGVLIYHHRRKVFLPHLRQIASYALHRGYFVKKFPQTSLRISYFIPSFFLFFIVFGGIAVLYSKTLRFIYAAAIFFYLSSVFVFSAVSTLRKGSGIDTISQRITFIGLVTAGIIVTHFTYGFYFLKGIFSKRLKEEP